MLERHHILCRLLKSRTINATATCEDREGGGGMDIRLGPSAMSNEDRAQGMALRRGKGVTTIQPTRSNCRKHGYRIPDRILAE